MSEKTYKITESELLALLENQRHLCSDIYWDNSETVSVSCNNEIKDAPTPDLSNLKEASLNDSGSIKVFTAISTSEIEEWLNEQQGIDYDSIKIRCDSCDNSTSGVQFTIVCKEASLPDLKDNWISVEERLPQINTDVLVCNETDKCVVCGFYDRRKWYNTFDESGCEIIPTHWQPLPQPPKAIVELKENDVTREDLLASDRENAMKWWNEQRDIYKQSLTNDFYSQRAWQSLTGREIEKIYVSSAKALGIVPCVTPVDGSNSNHQR
jgi:hypothetical protein